MKSKQAEGYRKFYCPVCGHVEWIPVGDELVVNYHCPLCRAPAKAMIDVTGKKFSRQTCTLEPIASGIYRVRKKPKFHPEYEHFSYIIQHSRGLILYDAPPVPDAGTAQQINSLGKPWLLVVSHGDFTGFADDWAEMLEIPTLMGHDKNLNGNRFQPDRRLEKDEWLAENLQLVHLPGHSPGSFGIYWENAPDGPALLAGDAFCVWDHKDNRRQVAFFQAPPIDNRVRQWARKPVQLLATCVGYMADAGPALKRLSESEHPCARPYLGETGGIWLA